MKKRILLLCITALLFFSLLVGCAKEEAPAEDPLAQYEARIAALEAELEKGREEKYISDAAYKEQIKELELRLKAQDHAQTMAPSSEDSVVFRYRTENGRAVITAYEGRSTLVTVPETLDGYPVAAIGERAFAEKNVVAVILPEGLESIGWFAFYSCNALVDVTIPSSVTSIGYAVFDGSPNVSIICANGSYAAEYAASYGLPHIAPQK